MGTGHHWYWDRADQHQYGPVRYVLGHGGRAPHALTLDAWDFVKLTGRVRRLRGPLAMPHKWTFYFLMV